MFSYNYVDVLFTFNFDLSLKLAFSQYFLHNFIDGYHFVLIEPLQLNLELTYIMVVMFVWNDVDMLFILNFDLDRKSILSQGKKDTFFNIMPLTGTTSYSVYQCWKI